MRLQKSGFTILETMIVLTVTGALLAASIVIFSSQQRRQQFNNATRDLESRVQDVMNDVSTGNYGALDGFSCTNGIGASPTVTPDPVKKPGTNPSCIFVGKAVQFQRTSMTVVTLVGNREIQIGASVRPATTFAETYPTILPGSEVVYPYLFGVTAWKTEPDGGAVVVLATTPGLTGFVNTSSPASGFRSGTQLVMPLATNLTIPIALSDPVSAAALQPLFLSSSLVWPTTGSVTVCVQDDAGTFSASRKGGIVLYSGTTGLNVTNEQDKAGAVC